MRRILLLSGCAALAAFLGSGCKDISLSDTGDSNRTLVGAAEFTPASGGDAPGGSRGLPADASMQVRVVDEHPGSADTAPGPAMNGGFYNGQSSAPPRAVSLGPQILGEAVVADAAAAVTQDPLTGSWQVPFKVPYTATDEQLRRGLNIEVRISYGGGVRYTNFNQYALTFGDQTDTHVVRLERMH
ncbi:MAG TPA: hypothetical protein VHC86_09285 [Opitutaceae bacterium]|nr:hypothetical protein [Opitutaceae bacterium]